MFIVPFSVKVAVTAGAITGGAIALMNNKEKVWEFSESLLQRGADYCRQQVEAQKQVMYAENIGDSELQNHSDSEAETETDYETELSTPNETDNEWEHDLDMESID